MTESDDKCVLTTCLKKKTSSPCWNRLIYYSIPTQKLRKLVCFAVDSRQLRANALTEMVLFTLKKENSRFKDLKLMKFCWNINERESTHVEANDLGTRGSCPTDLVAVKRYVSQVSNDIWSKALLFYASGSLKTHTDAKGPSHWPISVPVLSVAVHAFTNASLVSLTALSLTANKQKPQ